VRGYSAFSNLDCNVLAVDYRGFGDSTGTPSEKGLIKDARTVWDYVTGHDSGHGIKAEGDRGVILVGQSLGTGVVTGLAGQMAREGMSIPPVVCRRGEELMIGVYPRALVLIAPFTSVTELLES
jgi:abhydrolase domain-containing protein 12